MHLCSIAEACSLPKVVGPCKGSYPNWYYDPATDSCQPFNYSGCLGNNNRFDSKKLCESTCVKQAVLGEMKVMVYLIGMYIIDDII